MAGVSWLESSPTLDYIAVSFVLTPSPAKSLLMTPSLWWQCLHGSKMLSYLLFCFLSYPCYWHSDCIRSLELSPISLFLKPLCMDVIKKLIEPLALRATPNSMVSPWCKQFLISLHDMPLSLEHCTHIHLNHLVHAMKPSMLPDTSDECISQIQPHISSTASCSSQQGNEDSPKPSFS